MTAPRGRPDLWLLLAATLGGALFFSSLTRIWPLARIDVNVRPEGLVVQARDFLRTRDIDVRAYAAASALRLDWFALDYVTRSFGIGAAQQMIARGEPLYFYEIDFKKRGDPDSLWVDIHPQRGVIGWGRSVQEDARGEALTAERARLIALGAIGPATVLREKGHTERDRPARRD